jgi:hypothetical protein
LDNKELFLIPIVNILNSKLIEFGFARAENDVNNNYEIFEWKRNRDWIYDQIKLVFSNSNPTFFYLTMSANLIFDNKEVILQHLPISLLRHSKGEYSLPMFFKKMRAQLYIEKVIEDAICSLGWFDQFANKKDCLKLIELGQGGVTPQGTLYPAVIKLLSS